MQSSPRNYFRLMDIRVGRIFYFENTLTGLSLLHLARQQICRTLDRSGSSVLPTGPDQSSWHTSVREDRLHLVQSGGEGAAVKLPRLERSVSVKRLVTTGVMVVFYMSSYLIGRFVKFVCGQVQKHFKAYVVPAIESKIR